MTPASSVDEKSFRTLLSRNVALPLGVGVLSAVFFVCLITYLLSVIQWVEHTDRVINNLNESSKLTVDLETGMRGFLITGDEHFLDPYEVAKPRIMPTCAICRNWWRTTRSRSTASSALKPCKPSGINTPSR